MKKLFTLTFVLLFAFSNYAQITIADYSGIDWTNTTAFLPSGIDYHFEITNDGSSEITFIVEVTALTLPDDANGFAVCACGSCVPVSSAHTLIGSATTLAAGDTYGEEGNSNGELADVNYSSNGSTEQATITIKVYEEGNETNFAEFTLDTQHVGINSMNTADLISIYPNPATNYFTVKVSNKLKGSQLVFTNLLGKVVLRKRVDNSELTFSTNNLSCGVYFYSLIADNKIIETKKLIVK